MKYMVLTLGLLAWYTTASAQKTYNDSIALHRKHYKEDFIKEERSPLKGNDTAQLRFFDANSQYRVTAIFTPTPASEPFDMPTYSGKTKKFKQYGTVRFIINDTVATLCVYQNLKLLEEDKHKNHLFIPFTDATSYVESYAGGRYIDLEATDIHNGKVVVDFNKCYNPYCAYATGYNCPIPPPENRINIAIKAGEKLYAGKHKE